MKIEKTHTLIVGSSQAGLAMSEHLSNHGVEYLIVEKIELWNDGVQYDEIHWSPMDRLGMTDFQLESFRKQGQTVFLEKMKL